MNLKELQHSPAAFRANLLIDCDGSAKRLGSTLDDWQQADFEALDSGWQRAAGQSVEPKYLRSWIERCRGGSKTTDLAVMVCWALFASKRRLSGIAAAAGLGVLIAKLRENAQAMQAFGEISANVMAAFQEVWANLQGPVSYVGSLIKGVFEGAINQIVRFSDWLSLMTTNWSLTWELMKTNTAIVLMYIAQQGVLLFDTLKAGAIAGAMTIIQVFRDLASAVVHIFNVIVATGTLIWRNLGESISLVFQSVVQFAKGIFLGLWEAIKSGFSGGDIIGPFVEEFNRQIAQIDPMSLKMQQDAMGLLGGIDTQMPDIMGNAGKTFLDTFNANLGEDTPFGEQLDELKKQAGDIRGQMEAERDVRRAARASGTPSKADDVTAARDAVQQAFMPSSMMQTPALGLEQGRFGFTDLGTKIQDLLFKQDKDKQTTDLQKEGNQHLKTLVEQGKGKTQPALALTAES